MHDGSIWCKWGEMGKTIRHLRNWNKRAVGPQRAWGELLLLLFRPSVVSESLQPHGLQHARFPCLSLSPGVCSNSCPFIRWHHPTISSSVTPFSPCSQSVPASGLFQWVSSLHQVAKSIWSFSFSISPSSEHSGLISFRIDWFDLFPVQGTLKSLFQHHSLKTSILWPSAFFMVQFSHSYMITGKTINLTTWTLVGKVMSLLYNMLSSFVIAFFPRSKRLLIAWLQ